MLYVIGPLASSEELAYYDIFQSSRVFLLAFLRVFLISFSFEPVVFNKEIKNKRTAERIPQPHIHLRL
jgi:hypothetical protein